MEHLQQTLRIAGRLVAETKNVSRRRLIQARELVLADSDAAGAVVRDPAPRFLKFGRGRTAVDRWCAESARERLVVVFDRVERGGWAVRLARCCEELVGRCCGHHVESLRPHSCVLTAALPMKKLAKPTITMESSWNVTRYSLPLSASSVRYQRR